MRLSLRYQLLLPMLVLLLGVAGLGAWAAVRSVQQAVRQQIEAQLGQVAHTVSEASFPFTDRVLTHRTILKAIWGPNAVDQPEHLRVLVASLRRKLEPDPTQPRYILTEPWVGYRFADE